ncbi:MAG: CHASE2 domain-containing protein [Treponema sp.]|nr:CHASE2 domain-containing protein [Treponema sp.]
MKKYISYIVAFFAIVICCFSHFSNIDNKINDIFMKATHQLPESEDVVMLMIDDNSVEHVGTWPWNRNVMADTIVFARELGADSVVFDLSYLDPSSRSADPDYVQTELPNYIEQGFQSISENVGYIIDSFADGSLSRNDADYAKESFEEINEQVKNQIQTNVSYVVTDNDAYLANCLKFFENAYLTLDFENREQTNGLSDGSDIYYLASKIALQNLDASQDTKTPEFNTLVPALDCLIKKANGAGFVNSNPDDDGYRRRVHLVYKYDGVYYGQLVFVPLLHKFGNPEVIITNKNITLKDAKISETETKDIVIPRCEDGSVLINFPKKPFLDYNYISVWSIYQMKRAEKSLLNLLAEYDAVDLFLDMDLEDSPVEYYKNAEYVREALYEEDNEDFSYDDYVEFRNKFFESVSIVLSQETEDYLMALYGDDPDFAESYPALNEVTRETYNSLMACRERIRNQIDGAMLIAGTSATSTTDYGLILYEENFPNVGVHSAVANMILAEDFLDDSPWWISIIIAVLFCFLYLLIAKKLSTGKSLIVGISLLVVLMAMEWGFFALTKTYVGTFIPVVSLFITFVASTVIGYLTTSHEKKFIQGAFAQCLSKDVVNDIVSNPSSLRLGGVSREMTALFTDIQKFSGFSELLNAAELVALLNYYLTPMSDIIMDEGGMVDKYEGDAIVALVGAPLEMPDHAARACAAAIKMKKREIEMNKEILELAAQETADIPEELHQAFKKLVAGKRNIFTRIGLNSGEMVAGFMGSDAKKNYTMMGNNVNLASRLEGVNKQYSTGGIMISEATRKLIGDEFVVRSLDRVQVVNVKTPIRLYELMDTAADADESLVKYVSDWEEAIKTFESGDYAKSLEMFKKCSAARADDNVAKYYVTLIEKFFINGTYPKANDDFGVVYNAENPSDMDPSWVGTPKEIKGTFTLMSK